MSVNHVEYWALKCGYSVEIIKKDYGTDLLVFTYNENSEFENGVIEMQLKASDKPNYSTTNKFISYPVNLADLKNWASEIFPFIFVIYDATKEEAYWLHIQDYFKNGKMGNYRTKSCTVRINTKQTINASAMQELRKLKNRIQSRLERR